jgi:hypothetical protein
VAVACKLHGGGSTGPRTGEGLDRIVEAQRRLWEVWRAKNSRMAPWLSASQERRLHAKFKRGEPVPPECAYKFDRRRMRDLENEWALELMARNPPPRQVYYRQPRRRMRV